MAKQEKQKLRDVAEHHIRAMLIRGEIGPGTRLSDLTLSKELDISRTPVREAIRQLVSEGLAEHHPGLGVYLRLLSREEIEDLYDLRALLEAYAAEKAALRATDAQVKKLRRVCDQSRRVLERMRNLPHVPRTSDLGTQMVKLDVQFHKTMLQACNGSQVLKVAGELRLITESLGHLWKDWGANYWTTAILAFRDHLRILRAIERHDHALAAHLVRRHIQAGRDNALRVIEQLHQDKLPASDKAHSGASRSWTRRETGKAWEVLGAIG